MKRNIQAYQDIINLPRHISQKHPHMSIHDRAAQFAPFAALTGHAEAVNETARIVDRKIDLGEDAIPEIAEKLNYIRIYADRQTLVNITYFVQDEKKTYGGRYVTKQTAIKKTDDVTQTVILADGTAVRYDDISEIEITE